ncbi:MAG: response regulator [Acidobacteria bacterium]|nr:response regulator [Acidobacteriota bacterium]
MWSRTVSYVIFAVEDNPIAGEIVQTALESRGHSVALVSTGRNAIEWLSNNQCHLILLDLMLPDADGGQLVEVLRRLPNGAGIPILAFSAFASKLADLRRSGAPFDGYIAKPVEPEDLIRIVEQHLHPAAV